MIGLASQTNRELTPSLNINKSDRNNGLLVLSVMLPNVAPLSVWLLGFSISMLTPCIRGWGLFWPISGQYSGHVIYFDQSETSIQVTWLLVVGRLTLCPWWWDSDHHLRKMGKIVILIYLSSSNVKWKAFNHVHFTDLYHLSVQSEPVLEGRM